MKKVCHCSDIRKTELLTTPKLPLLALAVLFQFACGQTTTVENTETTTSTPLNWRPNLSSVLDHISEIQQNANTQTEMTISAFMELNVLDAELYIGIMDYAEHCSPAGRTDLFAAHTLWLEHRTAAGGESRSEFDGGSMAPMIEAMKMAEWTRIRTNKFNALERRTTCPSPDETAPALTLTDAGFGPIGMESPFSETFVSDVFPQVSTSVSTYEGETGMITAMELSIQMRRLGTISPDYSGLKVGSIELRGEGYTSPEGKYPGEYLDTSSFSCGPGMEHYSGFAMCTNPSYQNITYVFKLEDWEGPDGELPPQDRWNNLNLDAMIWFLC